jgi:hypothetical protein
VNDQTERPWFCFQLPDAISFAPGATEDDARDVMRKNSYAGAPVDSWPCLGSRFCSREALTRSLMRPRATDSVSPAPEARWPKYVQEQFGKRCASCHYANGHHQDTCPNLPSDWDPEYTHLAPYSADVLIADNGTRSVDPNTVPRPSEACPDCCAYTNEPCGKHEQRSNEAAPRCRWSSRIGYDCELSEGHEGQHAATDLDGKSRVGWTSSHRSAYQRQCPSPADELTAEAEKLGMYRTDKAIHVPKTGEQTFWYGAGLEAGLARPCACEGVLRSETPRLPTAAYLVDFLRRRNRGELRPAIDAMAETDRALMLEELDYILAAGGHPSNWVPLETGGTP